MRTLKILFTLLFISFALVINAQTYTVKGKVLGPDNLPVQNAIVSLSGSVNSVITNELGEFLIETNNENVELFIEAEGFYFLSQPLMGRKELKLVLIPSDKPFYNEEYILPFQKIIAEDNGTSAVNLNEKDFGGSNTIENALAGNIAGLRVMNKSGMPGEGAYFNLRGIRTLNTENSPLIVINGIPYLPDMNTSPIIGGYSKSIFNPYSLHTFHNVTVLKGAEASMYGSMGSNGVILIETDALKSAQLETNISFYGQYGVNWNNKRLPLLGVEEYKNYLMDIGITQYDNMAELFDYFPFLIDDPSYYYNYLYNNNTNWQKEIMSPSFTTDNLFRVEGGDAIAKYDISLGYLNEGGVLDGTKRNRYNTQINTNVLLGRNFEIFATIGAAYLDGHLMEQGMSPETNPMLAAYYKAPVLSPYKKDADGGILNIYDTYRYDVSNPVAITNTMVAKYRMYDINSRIGLNYNLNDLYRFSAVLSLYYNYNQENVFIPGKSDQTILPLNHGLNENTVRTGIGEG
ncbi:MAG: TonB-dependent receptor plug domain-containing protein, partial [Odoribacter sp.]|nr:TonB-dependent receptor plug domain-containing protein [Odoribacter sp.]